MLEKIVLLLFKKIIERQKSICIVNMLDNIRNDLEKAGIKSNSEIVGSDYADIVDKHLTVAYKIARKHLQ